MASYTGCTKVDAALVLGAFLNAKAPHVRLVVHKDRDYASAAAATAFVGRLSAAHVVPFLTERNDIEGYFLNAAHLHALNPTISVERIEELLTVATTETADKSVAAIVNQRTPEAFKIRQEGGPQVNHGEIAVQSQADYAADPTSMRRGKIILGRLQALLQQELGANPRVFLPSVHLRSQPLLEVAATIRLPH